MKKFQLVAMLLFSINVFSYSELKTYKDLNISDDGKLTWVIFDIDNTLIRPKEEIGSHQWADYMADRYLALGHTKEQSGVYQTQIFLRAQKFVTPQIVDQGIFSLLEDLNAKKIPFIALTARNAFTLKETTISQLKKVKLLKSFELNQPDFNIDSNFNEYFQQGIVFSNGLSKGEILKYLLQKSKNKPERIIFIDDKDYNVKSVEKAGVELGLEIQAFRFAYADDVVLNLNPEKSDAEWLAAKYLGSPLHSNVLKNPLNLATMIMNYSSNSSNANCMRLEEKLKFYCEANNIGQNIILGKFEKYNYYIENSWDLY